MTSRSRGINRRSTYSLARRRRRRPGRLLAITLIVLVAGAIIVKAVTETNTHGARAIGYAVPGPGGKAMPQLVVVPAHAARRPPLLVFLHGKGQDQSSSATSAFYAALAAAGPEAPDVVFPYGGEDSYWHNRETGDWGRYVMDGVIPAAIKRLHADSHRVAIAGLSMGGFGAYDLARLHPGRFCGVGADSAALWRQGGETATGAFDNGEDFERHNVIEAAQSSTNPYPGARLWLDVGTEDPFRPADTSLADALRTKGVAVSFHVWPGGHDESYWNSHWAAVLRFFTKALAACR